MSESTHNRILVVEDEIHVRSVCVSVLKGAGYEVSAAENAAQAIEKAERRSFDLVLTDIVMPGMSGDVLIDHLKVIQPDIVSIIMTGFASMDLAVSAMRKGVYDLLAKPFGRQALLKVVREALERRSREVQQHRQDFAGALLELQGKENGTVDLQRAVDSLSEGGANAQPLVILCEGIPQSANLLQNSENYAHLRTILRAQKILNKQIGEKHAGVEMLLVIARRGADLCRHLYRMRSRICGIIFGPNFPKLHDSTLRLMASAGRHWRVAVCHHPEHTSFSWNELSRFAPNLEIRTCSSAVSGGERKRFWSQFFAGDLVPLIGRRAAREDTRPLATDEVRERLARDLVAVETLPGFPRICQQAMDAIDQGERHTEVARIIQVDGGLHAAVMHTANLARYGARQRIETLPNALSMIGMEQTRKLLMGRAMSELMAQVRHAGFPHADLFLHSAAVGYMAQLLSLNVESADEREAAIVKSLALPEEVIAALKALRGWEIFPIKPEFDAFAAGVLHDLGKLANAICFQESFSLVQYEIERSRWQDSLLACERAVVGDLQHPASGADLLERWEIFPHLIEAIHVHHHVEVGESAETALISLANCLVKGMYPFPRSIHINNEFRRTHLEESTDVQLLTNPLPGLYHAAGNAWRRRSSGEKTGESPEAQIQFDAAVETLEQEGKLYVGALRKQNPELGGLERWTGKPVEELLVSGLMLTDVLQEKVDQLLQSSSRASRN